MNKQKIYDQLSACESAAELMLEECRKTKILLGGADRPAVRKGIVINTGVMKQQRKKRLQKTA